MGGLWWGGGGERERCFPRVTICGGGHSLELVSNAEYAPSHPSRRIEISTPVWRGGAGGRDSIIISHSATVRLKLPTYSCFYDCFCPC